LNSGHHFTSPRDVNCLVQPELQFIIMTKIVDHSLKRNWCDSGVLVCSATAVAFTITFKLLLKVLCKRVGLHEEHVFNAQDME
jgi:hypothetical protein